MLKEIKTITLTNPYLSVNCYILKSNFGNIMIDTGVSFKRETVEKALNNFGCKKPGDINLIILTHGDIDHVGNAAYFKNLFDTKIALHFDDNKMLEDGNVLWNRKKPKFMLKIVNTFFKLKKSERCKPDIDLKNGLELTNYGFDATVLPLPGHSSGSVGVLSKEGELFCGDLLANRNKPAPFNVDNRDEFEESIERLKGLNVHMVYPGHGTPFQFEKIL